MLENFQELIEKVKNAENTENDFNKSWLINRFQDCYNHIKYPEEYGVSKTSSVATCYTIIQMCYMFNVITNGEYEKIYNDIMGEK